MATITKELPVSEAELTGYDRDALDGRRRVHLDVKLSFRASRGLALLREGMKARVDRLSDGRPVWNWSDVLTQLFTELADRYDAGDVDAEGSANAVAEENRPVRTRRGRVVA